jgi:hypothetical protein
MEKSSQVAWKIVPLRHFFPLKVVPLIEVLLYKGRLPTSDYDKWKLSTVALRAVSCSFKIWGKYFLGASFFLYLGWFMFIS